jgi:phenylacetaldehyde dehydrogenase
VLSIYVVFLTLLETQAYTFKTLQGLYMAVQLLENDLSNLPSAVSAALARKPAHYIGGQWLSASNTIPVLDPSSGKQIAQVARGGIKEIDVAVRSAHSALRSAAWTGGGPMGRERLLMRLADLIEARLDTISRVETIDNGMPLTLAANALIPLSASVFRYFAGWPTKLTGETMEVSGPPGPGKYFGFTRREPVGVIGAIIPWNVPFMMAAWKLAPALAAGCTVVLKPAEDTSLSALLLADLIEEAGFPAGVVNIVTGYGREAGDALVKHPGVAKISFTGSTATGRNIAAVAGQNLKRLTLELGGKSPTLIFADANLDEAVPGAANSIYLNSGQTCVAGSRLYVQDVIYDQVLERLRAHIATLTVGPGLAANTAMGPLINANQQRRVQSFIDQAHADELTVFSGHALAAHSGFYISPTVVADAGHQDQITQEEIFGPVLSVYRFSDDERAIAAANGTSYGLAATIWSRDISRVLELTARLECGKVMVNNPGFPYPALPEGGYKASGYGRDLGREAVEQCLDTKSVLVKTS